MAKKSLFESMVFEVPWYFTFIFGIIIYITSFLVKNIKTGIISIGPILSIILKLFSVLFLIASFLSIGRMLLNKLLLKNTKSDEDLKKLSWQEFENLIEAYYTQKGYSVIHSGSNSADGGIDLIATKNSEKIIIQCKHWKVYKIDVKIIREIYGLLVAEKASKAIIITSGEFTQPAIEFASDKPIELINGEKLLKMISEVHNKVEERQTNISKTPDKSVILCPKCGSPMILKVAKHGEYAGKKFWGCSNYPKCKYIISIE